MVPEINFVAGEDYPATMEPGEVYIVEIHPEAGRGDDLFRGVLACPECGDRGMITIQQMNGVKPIVCESKECLTTFVIFDGYVIVPRKLD